ncbi:MAG TPA: peptide-N4-asparagine amidase [Tahibacter sp.]|uniref:peptide-N4-asparagine amidase n=1 Tax=Tahibacter sp. TaxID=2056211 RepID=UPI002BEFA9CB|nr:peptide-N4-asparagine amidase [Tahibacter sp.]HSX58599.1 peptide-N4-asparagine amidase [Tahibacter sp.]
MYRAIAARLKYSFPLLLIALFANPPAAADPPAVGARGAVVADPVVPLPPGEPCVVALYRDETFSDFSLHDFSYAPPANCPGPYAKIVLRADFDVTTGRQFDRTANLWIGAVNLYFGTTQEPSAIDAPRWRIERDVSDYVSLLSRPQGGKIDLGNIVNDTYTGILHGSAELLFFRDTAARPDRPRRPDRVLPMSGGALGGVTDLNGPDARFERTFTLPRNIERVFLDVIAQSQGADEFWMTCVPDDLAEQLQSCGHTAFRETLVRIDGEPAGIAHVYPWLYTGAIDPGLWRPIPAPQTFSFEPWRIDLTPFAAKLNDGAPHTVTLSVHNAGDRFSMAANLLLFLDAGRAVVTGALTENTVAAVSIPRLTRNVTETDGVLSAGISTESVRGHLITGHVDTSHGRVTTSIDQRFDFNNYQQFRISANLYTQDINQSSYAYTVVRRTQNGRTTILRDERFLPLSIAYQYEAQTVGARQTTRVAQKIARALDAGTEGWPLRSALSVSEIDNQGSILFAGDGSLALRETQKGWQSFHYVDPFGACYRRAVSAERGAVTSVIDGEGCPDGRNTLRAFDHFHNFASAHYGASVQLLP